MKTLFMIYYDTIEYTVFQRIEKPVLIIIIKSQKIYLFQGKKCLNILGWRLLFGTKS
jgi:hypothetical protein